MTTYNDQANGGYKFKFSVIMAVYNVSEFIEEAVQSIVDQTIGFKENIQIILSNDGSTDDSGEKCDKLKSLYPDNIVVVHKKNGGPGSARNAALPYIEGRYVNFMDPDDTISSDTFRKVYTFFTQNEHLTDYVAIPMYFFGALEGPHHLNNKFGKGTRVINLLKEYQFSQYSEASAFIKHDIAKNQCFSESLVVAEDAQQIMRILINKPTLGVIDEGCRYNYRRRDDSLISTGTQKKGWYTDYLKLFCMSTIDYALEKLGYVPKFVQNTIMGDLRWRYNEDRLPTVLNKEETKEYLDLLKKVTSYISDEVIMYQPRFLGDIKVKIISERSSLPYEQIFDNDIIYGFDNRIDWRFSKNILQLSFMDIEEKEIKLYARHSVFASDMNSVDNYHITVNGKKIIAQQLGSTLRKASIGTPVAYWNLICFTIPKDELKRKASLSFFIDIKGMSVKCEAVKAADTFITSDVYKHAYCYTKGLMIKLRDNSLIIEKVIKA